MIRQFLVLTAAACVLVGCGHQSATPRPWAKVVNSEIRALGYRNWIVIGDSAFPVHSRRGVRTVVVEDEIPEVLDEVLNSLENAQNVTPRIYTSRELRHIPNDRAPGVDYYRKVLDKALHGFPTREMEFRLLSLLLEDSANKFAVLVFKTNTALPYSSVFIELDSAYWDRESERELRERLDRRTRVEST